MEKGLEANMAGKSEPRQQYELKKTKSKKTKKKPHSIRMKRKTFGKILRR